MERFVVRHSVVESLHEQFGQVMFRIAVSVTRNAALAEEAVQEAWIRIWQSLEKISIENMRSWVLKVARNSARLVVRHERVRYMPTIDNEESPIDCSLCDDFGVTETPERLLVVRDGCQSVRTAIKVLPPHYALALTLSEFDELTNAASAEVLGVKEDAFAATLRRARKALSDVLVPAASIEVCQVKPCSRCGKERNRDRIGGMCSDCHRKFRPKRKWVKKM